MDKQKLLLYYCPLCYRLEYFEQQLDEEPIPFHLEGSDSGNLRGMPASSTVPTLPRAEVLALLLDLSHWPCILMVSAGRARP